MATERIGVLAGFPEAMVIEESRKLEMPSIHRFMLISGNKRLALTARFDWIQSSTAISTDSTAIKIPGATSAVYQRAADILEALVQQHRKPSRYVLSTYNNAMKLWARDQVRGGAAIFDWDSIREDDTGLLTAKKTFGKEFSLKGRVIWLFRRK